MTHHQVDIRWTTEIQDKTAGNSVGLIKEKVPSDVGEWCLSYRGRWSMRMEHLIAAV